MNHSGDANKMVGEDVSNEQMTAQATPNEELRRQILSHFVPKNEREWWAASAIERLELELNAANERIKRLVDVLGKAELAVAFANREHGVIRMMADDYTEVLQQIRVALKSNEEKP